jgi:hypothetical protein
MESNLVPSRGSNSTSMELQERTVLLYMRLVPPEGHFFTRDSEKSLGTLLRGYLETRGGSTRVPQGSDIGAFNGLIPPKGHFFTKTELFVDGASIWSQEVSRQFMVAADVAFKSESEHCGGASRRTIIGLSKVQEPDSVLGGGSSLSSRNRSPTQPSIRGEFQNRLHCY